MNPMRIEQSCGYILAPGVCRICFEQRGEHTDGCPLRGKPESIKDIIGRLPITVTATEER
jgi:hypothetical protein